MAKLVVAGVDETEPVVELARRALHDLGHEITTHLSAMSLLKQSPDWPSVDILIAANAECERSLIQTGSSLRAIISPIIGYDGVDVAAASDCGVLIANGRTAANANSMAEATIMLMLAATYDLRGAMARMREPSASRSAPSMISGKTIGIIGYGAIARAVIERPAGWDCRILVHTSVATTASGNDLCFTSLENLLECSDIVLVLTHLTTQTRHLLDRDRLRAMKRGAILVNTSRGGIVDELALAELLEEGHLATAALDVFETEPLAPASPLRDLHILLTPHCVGHTVESIRGASAALRENVEAVLAGCVPVTVCNPEVVEAWQRRWSVRF